MDLSKRKLIRTSDYKHGSSSAKNLVNYRYSQGKHDNRLDGTTYEEFRDLFNQAKANLF